MRWEDLFEDLEAQLAAEDAQELAAQVEELQEAERSRIALLERVVPGALVRVGLRDGQVLTGTVREVGQAWLVLATRAGSGEQEAPGAVPTGGEVLLPGSGVDWLEGATRVAADRNLVTRRLRLGHILRALAREEAEVVVTTRGRRRVRGAVTGAGSDYVEVEPGSGSSTSIRWEAIVSVLLA